jgi:hypothetical protein
MPRDAVMPTTELAACNALAWAQRKLEHAMGLQELPKYDDTPTVGERRADLQLAHDLTEELADVLADAAEGLPGRFDAEVAIEHVRRCIRTLRQQRG